jgi:hypothetical protein
VFRYFDAFDRYADFGFFSQTPALARWRKTLLIVGYFISTGVLSQQKSRTVRQ